MNVTFGKLKMIGTTSGFESHEEVMYPSISVCSRRRGDEYRNKSDVSLFQRSVNLRSILRELRLFRKNDTVDTGHEQMIIRPSKEDVEYRDKIVVELLN